MRQFKPAPQRGTSVQVASRSVLVGTAKKMTRESGAIWRVQRRDDHVERTTAASRQEEYNACWHVELTVRCPACGSQRSPQREPWYRGGNRC